MSLKLYTDKASAISAWKILAAANYSGVKLTVVSDFSSDSTDFQAKTPAGKPPVLETEQGSIFEENAIARYVARQGESSLLGSTAFEQAQVDSWIEFSVNEIDLPASVWTFPILGYIANNAAATQKAKADIRHVFEVLNKHLASRTFLVGHRVTLADLSVAASLYHLYQLVIDVSFRKAFVNVTRWYLTVVNQPNVKPVFGDVQLCEKAQVAPETAEAPKEEAKKVEKPKEEPKKAEKPKAEKKPAKEADDEEEESFADEAPKGKNPLDLLPPAKMNMDEWKRMYSNNDTRSVAMPWFWQHLDTEGYSLWFCRYKYNSELTVTFMTSNLIGGYMQRLEKLRKYGFGSMLIFGEDNASEIEGAWLVRGTEMPAELTECDDSVLYDWKRVDIADEAQKKLLEDFWAWDGEFAARSAIWGTDIKTGVKQGKTFK